MLRAIINNDVDVLDSLHPKKRTAKTVEFFMQFNFVVHLPPKKTIIINELEKKQLMLCNVIFPD